MDTEDKKSRFNLRIEGGPLAGQVKIYAGDTEVKGINKIEIDPLVPNGLLTGRLYVIFDQVNIEVEMDKVAKDARFEAALDEEIAEQIQDLVTSIVRKNWRNPRER